MRECYVLKRNDKQNRTSVRDYLIEILDVLVHEYTIPFGKINDLRYKFIKNKYWFINGRCYNRRIFSI